MGGVGEAAGAEFSGRRWSQLEQCRAAGNSEAEKASHQIDGERGRRLFDRDDISRSENEVCIAVLFRLAKTDFDDNRLRLVDDLPDHVNPVGDLHRPPPASARASSTRTSRSLGSAICRGSLTRPST